MLQKKTGVDFELIQNTLKNNHNYQVLDFENDSRQCFIFFSSNGIFFPNADEVFQRTIIEQDRYEWKKNIPKSVRKIVFVRDIQKQWYLNGINTHINSVEKLCDLLHAESAGLDTVCVGSSAGGYAATLIGCMIRSSHVINFSGQFTIDTQRLKKTPNKFLSIVEIIDSSQVPIFYFFPERCPIDIVQSQLVKNSRNVHSFAFDVEGHGVPCYPVNLIDLFARDLKQLLHLHAKWSKKKISPFRFSLDVSGYRKTLAYIFLQIVKKLRNV